MPVRVIAAAWRAPGDADPDALPLALLAGMASGRAGAPLEQALTVQHPDCLALQSGFDGRRQGALFYVIAAVRPDADSARVERDLTSAVERFASQALPAELFERARRQEETAMLFGWQTSRRRAESIGNAVMVDGDAAAAGSRLTRLGALTPEAIQAAARRVLDPAHRVVVWVTPSSALAQPEVQLETAADGRLLLVGNGWRPGQKLVVSQRAGFGQQVRDDLHDVRNG